MKITLCSWFFLLLLLDGTHTNAQDLTPLPPREWNAYDANRWNSFDGWRYNSPMARMHARATSVLKEQEGGTSREVMVMYGGVLNEAKNTMWTYDPQFSTWEAQKHSSSQPRATVYHTLVTLCQKRVMLFGGSAFSSESHNYDCSNETWIFDTKHSKWIHIDTRIHPHHIDYVTRRCRHAAAVIRYGNSSCSCKDSMIIYGGFRKRSYTWNSNSQEHLDDLWQLICKNESSYVYEWVKLHPSGHLKPKLRYASAISAFQNTAMYLFGQAEQTRSERYWQVWYYDVHGEIWSKIGNASKQSTVPGQGVYVTDDIQSFHFLISCCSQPLIAFDLITKEWFSPQMLSNEIGPFFVSDSAVVTKICRNVFAFGGSRWIGNNAAIMWELLVTSVRVWHWLARPAAAATRNPLGGIAWIVSGIVLKQTQVLVFGNSPLLQDNNQPFKENVLHILDLKAFAWSVDTSEKRPPFKYCSVSAVLYDSVFVIYGGLSVARTQDLSKAITFSHEIWGYYSDIKTWIKFSTTGERKQPPLRVLCSCATTDNHTMITYGGLTMNAGNMLVAKLTSTRELWSFAFEQPAKRNLSSPNYESRWHLVDDSGPSNSAASSLVVIDNTLILYGGGNVGKNAMEIFSRHELDFSLTLSCNCSSSIWEYDLTNGSKWRQVKYSGLGPGRRCLHQGVQYGKHMVIFGGCHNHILGRWDITNLDFKFSCPVDPVTTGMWIYNPSTRFWLRLNQDPFVEQNGLFTSSLTWDKWILAFGGIRPSEIENGNFPNNLVGFSVCKPSCPAGFTSTDLRKYMCSMCPLSYYWESMTSTCSRCPQGLTTTHTASTSKTDCNRCLPGYCVYGSCTVTLQGPAFNCVCQFGFTKDGNGLCTVATYYIAASGFLAGVTLIVLLVVLTVKARRARKRHNIMLKDKDRELVEITNSFNIDSRELRLRGRIDKSAPGGYGEVHKAEYREMTVAVKKLQGIHQQLYRIELEFEREIEMMRTIRHPNIVLFLGGGRYHNDGCPFLVVEYMPRGSLTTILANEDIELKDSLKIRFAIDAAKGMRFLHSQRPPRIHRDLKSANLLVSNKWVVKVADFGAARLVRDEGISQEAVRGAGPLAMTAPLLHADYQLSSGVGTPKWSAPEILSGHSYGTPADIYSFGIVMWEIKERKLPYHDRPFRSVLDLKTAVLNGTRPTVSENGQYDYVKLMSSCWAGNASSRPTFCRVVVCLETMSELFFL